MAKDRPRKFELSPFQQKLLLVPEQYDVFLGGGRGGAKSFSLALLAMRHAEQYQGKARILYLRKTYKGLADFEAITRDIFGLAYGEGARFNAAEHVWRLPNGAYMELGQLEDPGDYQKYQGRSFTLLLIDEGGQYADPMLLDKLRSNLRGPKGMPIRSIMAANPGDPGHQWLAARYVFKNKPWLPFYEDKSKRQWVYCPSRYTDNPFIDQAEYSAQLEASCPADPELLRAWLDGDWTVSRGAYFASVLEESRNAIDPWPVGWINKRDWWIYLAHDYGSSAPSCTYVCAMSPGAQGPDGQWYPPGSIVLLDELAIYQPGSLNKGMGYTVPRLSEEIRDLSKKWRLRRAEGVADDSIFSNHGSQSGSIADEFNREKVYFTPAKKADRRSGWEIMRRLLQDAGKPDVPGLYISRECEYFWQTVPYLGRDPRKPDDVDTASSDHAADAVRYGCLAYRATFTQTRLKGMW